MTATLLGALAGGHGVARGGDSPRAIEAIENDLVADDAGVRAKAALEPVDRFPDGAVAVPMLVDLLDDESPEVVAAAAKAIDSMAIAGAVPLAAWCADDARFGSPLLPKLTFAAALQSFALMRQPPAALVFDKPASSGIAALGALLDFDDAPSAMTCLVELFRGSSGETQTLAAAALALLGSDGLVTRLIGPSPMAARAEAVSLATALVRSDLDLRSWCGCRILLRLRSVDAGAIAALTGAMTTPKKRLEWFHDEHAPIAACHALGVLGPSTVSVAALREVLSNAAAEKSELRDACTRALLRTGGEDDVRKLLTSGDAALHYSIALSASLETRLRETVVPILLTALKTSQTRIGMYAMGIGNYGPAAGSALPVIQEQCDRARRPEDVVMCLNAILEIAPGDSAALDRLLAITRKSVLKELEGELAMSTLSTHAPVTPPVVARLHQAVAQAAASKPSVGWMSAVDGLGRCGPAAKGAVADLVLLVAMANKNYANTARRPFVARQQLALTLGRIGPDAAAAIPALEALKSKGDETIRVPAAQALRRIKAKK